jgi:hypothetical protein
MLNHEGTMNPLARLWRNPFRSASSTEPQSTAAGRRGQQSGMFVRLAGGRRIEIPDAAYVMPADGRVVFLDDDRKVVQEFPWGDVVAYGKK